MTCWLTISSGGITIRNESVDQRSRDGELRKLQFTVSEDFDGLQAKIIRQASQER
jgi:hypothetical protein